MVTSLSIRCAMHSENSPSLKHTITIAVCANDEKSHVHVSLRLPIHQHKMLYTDLGGVQSVSFSRGVHIRAQCYPMEVTPDAGRDNEFVYSKSTLIRHEDSLLPSDKQSLFFCMQLQTGGTSPRDCEVLHAQPVKLAC